MTASAPDNCPQILKQWGQVIGERPIEAREVVAVAEARTRRGRLLHSQLREALGWVADNYGSLDVRRLSRWLGTATGHSENGRQIVAAGAKNGRKLWRLVTDRDPVVRRPRPGPEPEPEPEPELLDLWAEVIGERPIEAREVVMVAEERTRRGRLLHSQFREALFRVAFDRGGIDVRRLGCWLGAVKGHSGDDGRAITFAGIRCGRARWRLLSPVRREAK